MPEARLRRCTQGTSRWFVGLLVLFAFLASIGTEAIACGSELEADHAAEASQPAAGDQQTPADGEPDEHKACTHGHCHHAAAAEARVPAAALQPAGAAVPANRLTAAVPSHPSTGLKRPPRA